MFSNPYIVNVYIFVVSVIEYSYLLFILCISLKFLLVYMFFKTLPSVLKSILSIGSKAEECQGLGIGG